MARSERFFFDEYLEHQVKESFLAGDRKALNTSQKLLEKIRFCFGNRAVSLKEIDKDWVLRLRRYLVLRGYTPRTMRAYLRKMHGAYTDFLAKYRFRCGVDPFTEADRMVRHRLHRKDELDILDRMSHIELDNEAPLCFARDLFLFNHLAGGMNFRDLAMLKKENLQHGKNYWN